MWVTRSAPSTRVNPRVTVVLPAALSPTMPSTIGLCFLMVPPCTEYLPALGVGTIGFNLRAAVKDPALPNVRSVDANQLFPGDASALGDHAVGLAKFDAVNGVSHAARIGKLRLLPAQVEIFDKRLA